MRRYVELACLCVTLVIVGTVEAGEDRTRIIELLRDQDVIVVVGESASSELRAAARRLAEASHQPIADDVRFIGKGDRRWAFNGWHSGMTFVAIGTSEDNTLIGELFHTARNRPESLWGAELTSSLTHRYFAPGSLNESPWLGAPFACLTGTDDAAIIEAVDRLTDALVGTPRPMGDLDAWLDHIMTPTWLDSFDRDPAKRSIRYAAARGERVWIKLIVRGDRACDDVTLDMGVPSGPADLPPFDVYHLYRRSIGQVTELDEVMVPIAAEGRTARLAPVSRNRNECYLIEYVVPRDAPAGAYQAELVVRTREHRRSLTVELEVHDFDLPADMPVSVFFYGDISPPVIREFFKADTDAAYETAVRSIARQFRKFGATVMPSIDYSNTVRWIMIEGGRFRIDYQPMDQLITWMTEEGLKPPYIISVRLDRPRRPRMFDTYGRSEIYDESGVHHALRRDRGEPPPFVPLAWRRGMSDVPWIEDLARHVESRGWAGDVRIYAGDEPSDLVAYRESVAAFRDAGFRPITSLNRTAPKDLVELIDVLNPWILLYHPWRRDGENAMHDRWQAFAAERRELGEKFWWYHCIGLVARYRPFSWSRRFAWQSWAYNLDGIGFWSPFSLASMANRERTRANALEDVSPSPLGDLSWDVFANADVAFYNDTKNHRLLGSRRMAILAISWEDYKYLRKIDTLIDQVGREHPASREAIDARREAYDLISGRESGHETYADARTRLAEHIVRLTRLASAARN